MEGFNNEVSESMARLALPSTPTSRTCSSTRKSWRSAATIPAAFKSSWPTGGSLYLREYRSRHLEFAGHPSRQRGRRVTVKRGAEIHLSPPDERSTTSCRGRADGSGFEARGPHGWHGNTTDAKHAIRNSWMLHRRRSPLFRKAGLLSGNFGHCGFVLGPPQGDSMDLIEKPALCRADRGLAA